MLPARRPFPDELCCSAVLRCCRQFNVSFKRLGSVDLGRGAWRPSFLGASPLKELADLFALTPDELLWRHSNFPYATAMMQPRYYESANTHVRGEADVVKRLASVMQNLTSGISFRRYCPMCAREDLETVYETYWHRSHHLPGVLVCARHACFLHETPIAIKSHGSLPKTRPEDTSGRPLGRGRPSPFLLAIAQTSTQWLDRPPGPGSPIEPTAYRSLAIERGWLSPSREVEVALMTKALSTLAPKNYFLRAGAPLSTKAGLWASMMLRPGTTLPFTPFKHAVMQALLRSDPGDEGPPLDRYGGGPGASSASEMDKLYSREAKKELKRVLSQGSVLTTEQFLRGVGCWSTYRHRMGELPKLRAVVREFRGSAATVKRLRPGKQLYRLSRPDDAPTDPKTGHSPME